ncbi:hypothetical protein HA402_013723 [Bradysia odoriphaga]|nr:hypothetical protein HA402_013723 [Bradysia odoriphaga]
MDDKLRNQCKESELWLLIQYERPQNVYNYDIIHSSKVVQKDNMHTGKTIDFRLGNSVLKAVIFIISDDKNFLETEMRALTRAPVDDRNHKPVETYKRRRRATPSPIEYKPNASISRLPSPAWSNNTNESMTSNLEKQMTAAPPMTFDQGTQTDLKLMSTDGGLPKDLSKITQQLEMLLIENQQLRKENQQTKQMLADVANNTYDVKAMMNDIHRKLELNHRDPHIINSQMKANNDPIVLYAKSSDHIVDLNHAEIDNDVAIETYDVNNESSNISYSNCSRLSAVSNASIYNSTMMASQQSSSAGESANNTHSSMANDIKNNWKVIDLDEVSEEVTIGSNGTKVHKSVLDSVKWTSHSSATRKLLSSLFTREILATHSLTGKPSPAFMDSTKPTKNQLNALIIADIVQFVSQRCGVTDTAVRSAITTKCADENKMFRQRMEKKRKVLHSMENSNNKENSDVDVKMISHNSTL